MSGTAIQDRATIASLRGDHQADELAPAKPGWTIRDLSLDLLAGTTALVGLTGAGKTTTALLACGVYRPGRGRVLVDGTDLHQIAADDRRRMIAVLTQDPYVAHTTLRDNLRRSAPDADDSALLLALSQAQLLPTVLAMPDGLSTVIGDRGYRLSGGERQRLALARVLLSEPDVLIMDEATAHLDVLTEVAITEVLNRLNPTTVRLVVAHRLSTIEAADRIVVMAAGRVTETGDHEQLVARGGVYAGMVRTMSGNQSG